jgi:hypothetical protein
VRIEQRGFVMIERRAKKIDIRKSKVTKITLVVFTASIGDDLDGGDDHDGDGHGGDGSHFTPRSCRH